ncbi:MAG: FAD-dependent oxidoreductase [SAR202 cluster bacterium]|nr:FAD-dependent oxidoreductase [SAR202 cluster bacterium]
MSTSSSNDRADILIVGGGTGGCAAALAATSMGKRVIMTEDTDWVGGQLTSQGVPPDEHTWIERFGCTGRYRRYRETVRQYYKAHYPLSPAARSDPYLNPGYGFVSRLCHEPRVALAVLEQMMASARAKGLLQVRLRRRPVAVDTDGDRVRAVMLLNQETGALETIEADYVLDATELGDLLPLAGVEHVTGFESQRETGELHAPADAQPDNVQAFSWVFAMGYDSDGDHTIDRPAQYEHWRNFTPELNPPWGAKLLSWERNRTHGDRYWRERYVLFPEESRQEDRRDSFWHWRRIAYRGHYLPEAMPNEVTLVIWPQNDYFMSNIIDKPEDEVERRLEEARQLSLSFLYWMQVDAPRPDGGVGYPGLYPCPDVMGTGDGLAKHPYIRESRRIKAAFTVTEQHIGADAREGREAEVFSDTVGVGCYHIDLHASSGGDNFINLDVLPFQIPLGSLIPVRVENLLPACKNVGTTHLSNGSFRLHPVEWNIGESAGLLAAFCLERGIVPRAVREKEELLAEFQNLCLAQGIELEWPKLGPEDRWAAFDKRVLGVLPLGAVP